GKVESPLLSDRATKHGHDHRRHEANTHFRIAELCLLVGENEIARRRESGPSSKGASPDDGHGRLGCGSQLEENSPQSLRILPVCFASLCQQALQRSEIGTGTEVLTFAAQRNHSNLWVICSGTNGRG